MSLQPHICGIPVRLVESTADPDGMEPLLDRDERVIEWRMTEAAIKAMFGPRAFERYCELTGEGKGPNEPRSDA